MSSGGIFHKSVWIQICPYRIYRAFSGPKITDENNVLDKLKNTYLIMVLSRENPILLLACECLIKQLYIPRSGQENARIYSVGIL